MKDDIRFFFRALGQSLYEQLCKAAELIHVGLWLGVGITIGVAATLGVADMFVQ